MAIAVTNVTERAARNVRNVLNNGAASTSEAGLWAQWVDQIHKDLHRAGCYRGKFIQRVQTTWSAGVAEYLIGSATRRVVAVFDLDGARPLMPLTGLADTTRPPEGGQLPQFPLGEPWPRYYSVSGNSPTTEQSSIIVVPMPRYAGTSNGVSIYYEPLITDNIGESGGVYSGNITLPEDAIDMLVAGVTAKASKYLGRDHEAAVWTMIYEASKKDAQLV